MNFFRLKKNEFYLLVIWSGRFKTTFNIRVKLIRIVVEENWLKLFNICSLPSIKDFYEEKKKDDEINLKWFYF